MTERIGKYAVHRVANLFPQMEPEKFDELVADIRERGQIEKIVVANRADYCAACDSARIVWSVPEPGIATHLFCADCGEYAEPELQIIDGRHRARACEILGIEPSVRVWADVGGGSLVGYAVALNLLRRHMTASQHAAIGLRAMPMLAEEARQRYAETVGRPKESSVPGRSIIEEPRKAASDAAKLVGISTSTMERAIAIEKAAPEIIPDILSGARTVKEAARSIRRAETHERIRDSSERSTTLPNDVGRLFPVIYADPPWRYEAGTTDDSRIIENQYPTMDIEDIKALTVPALDDAVLFLWATSPLLSKALAVIDAWGFTYKTCAVWTKAHIGMGYYFRQQHELLLVAARGALPVPEPATRCSSVFSSDVSLRHSEKPDSVRKAIERMYPDLPRIEMFARAKSEGWSVWGNEVRAE
ncbi:MAG: hypothetical protein H0U66_06185 [Gemmatimonadaceae bacterium]|nr:hypothetical protein [Gemmatimonadaceae bacterium]